MATVLDEVREDHRKRYEFAIQQVVARNRTKSVLDVGCGVGYGSAMLAEVVDQVTSIEKDDEAREIFEEHWKHPNIDFCQTDFLDFDCQGKYDAIVCFEFIEHVAFFDEAIARFSKWSDFLIISTPNEEVRPHLQEPVNPFHFRHFRPSELQEVLEKHSYSILSWHCQRNGSKPEILDGTQGKFIIAVCRKVR
jgi:2-polyprenyl-3-methyl-5-hydroxy-6-metoxy-1,4-benzoquinol methylase